MLVKDRMTRNVHLIDPDAAVTVAARKMRDQNVGSLPVGSGGQVMGMVTDRDLVVRILAEGRSGHSAKVREVMSTAIQCCFDDQPIEEARQIMSQHQLRRLAVLSRQNRLVGILSLTDLAGGGLRSKPYHVAFYKSLTTSSGRSRDVPLATVYVSPDHTTDEVITVAVEKFQADFGLGSWRDLADRYEIVGQDGSEPPPRAASRR